MKKAVSIQREALKPRFRFHGFVYGRARRIFAGMTSPPHPSDAPRGGKFAREPRVKLALKYLLALAFAAAGANHFIDTGFYVSIMPPYLPWPELLVYLSGFFAIAFGVALLAPRFTRAAAWGLIALSIAVFPANIHMALHPELFPQFSPAALWLRLPFQALIIAWAYWYARPGRGSGIQEG